VGLARVKHVAPMPRFTAPRPAVDPQTLQAVVTNRYDVLARYAQTLRRALAEEIGKLRKVSPADASALEALKPWLDRDEKMLRESERERLAEVLPKSRVLLTMVAMRSELVAVWKRSTATREQLVKQLQDWCRRAEASGIRPLMEFSQHLRSYA
jgi:stearoyl-CoA desaturase (delta-9 desaturase)